MDDDAVQGFAGGRDGESAGGKVIICDGGGESHVQQHTTLQFLLCCCREQPQSICRWRLATSVQRTFSEVCAKDR
ncbi:hypothetical protein J2S04_002571 [Alicyclobacillus tengchongensis]|uniref:Uncharacterized protein n=1 Tax=Alicyclobacillus tolerans TaxID=90970 RepID=A0ABT9LZ94_9BACL|nr:hypothetical protein [Alicyclobacillus tengchongensis]